MTILLLLALSAFEFNVPSGRANAMVAGAAVDDWQHGLTLNPALIASGRRLQGACSYARPFGLAGLMWGRAAAGWRFGRFALAGAASSLSLDRYHEHDVQLDFAARALSSVTTGMGAHVLVLDQGPCGVSIVPSFDMGVRWEVGQFDIGASALRLNVPRWPNGDIVPVRLSLAGTWRPVESLLLALDVSRDGESEAAAAGVEFRLIPPLGLRFGVGTTPLRFAGGVGLQVGPLGVDYAYQFHPQLHDTHLFGVEASWR